METALVVANPAASRFTAGLLRTVVNLLRRRYRVEPVWPNEPGEARRMVAASVATGVSLVVGIGGDGVLHHIAQALVGTEAVMGIIPAGTANVFSRQLGIPRRPTTAAKLLVEDHEISTEPVLSAKATGPGGDLERSVLFALGMGADAEVLAKAEEDPYLKRGLGLAHYVASTVRTISGDLRRVEPDLQIRAGDRSAVGIGALAQFRLSYTHYGPLALRLSGSPPDPITILMVKELRLRRMVGMFRAAIGPKGLGHVRGLEVWEGCRDISVISPRPFLAQADGEVLGPLDSISAHLVPDAFKVVVPQV